MRVITLYQPYATALVLTLADNTRPGVARLKANETRSWHHPKVTGTIGIAAAASPSLLCRSMNDPAPATASTWSFNSTSGFCSRLR